MFIRLSELKKRIGLCRSAIYDRLDPTSPRHDPSFPRLVKLGGGKRARAVGFEVEAVERWVREQVERSTVAAPPKGTPPVHDQRARVAPDRSATSPKNTPVRRDGRRVASQKA
jgi:prophage regulatory protein